MGFLVSLSHTFLASGTGRARIAGTETRVSSGRISDCGPSHKPLSTGRLLVKNYEAGVLVTGPFFTRGRASRPARWTGDQPPT